MPKVSRNGGLERGTPRVSGRATCRRVIDYQKGAPGLKRAVCKPRGTNPVVPKHQGTLELNFYITSLEVASEAKQTLIV